MEIINLRIALADMSRPYPRCRQNPQTYSTIKGFIVVADATTDVREALKGCRSPVRRKDLVVGSLIVASCKRGGDSEGERAHLLGIMEGSGD